MKKAQVFCRFPKRENSEGIDFYLQFDGETYFLFNQRYRSNIPMFFESGMPLEMALKMPKKKAPVVIKNICEKLPTYIRYIEKEYEIAVLDKTMKKGRVYC